MPPKLRWRSPISHGVSTQELDEDQFNSLIATRNVSKHNTQAVCLFH